MPKVIVAMLGARRHYAVPRLLHEAGLLSRFYTDIYIGNKSFLKGVSEALPFRFGLLERLKGRYDPFLPPEKVNSFDLLGIWSWWLRRSMDESELNKVYAKVGKAFSRAVARTGLGGVNIVYGFHGESLELFERAKSKGIACVLEQTIAPLRVQERLLREEHMRWLGADTPRVAKGGDPLLEREEREWELADLILIGSQFGADGLRDCGVRVERIRVVPYGVSLERFKPADKPALRNRRLRILFVGEVGLRKGAPYLLEALKLLSSSLVEAWFVGRVSLTPQFIRRYVDVAKFHGAVARRRIKEFYDWADVLVLPSICEGSATVTYEALASGIPVVATYNTGSPVRDGTDGHIVPIRDIEAIAGVIEGYLTHPALLEAQRQSAIESRERVGLESYRKNLVDAVLSIWG